MSSPKNSFVPQVQIYSFDQAIDDGIFTKCTESNRYIPGNCLLCFNLGYQMHKCITPNCKGHYERFVPTDRFRDGNAYCFHPIFISQFFGADCIVTLTDCVQLELDQRVKNYEHFITNNDNIGFMMFTNKKVMITQEKKTLLTQQLNPGSWSESRTKENIELIQSITNTEWPTKIEQT